MAISSLESRLLSAIYIPKQAIAEQFMSVNYCSYPWNLSTGWFLFIFFKLADIRSHSGKWGERGLWSTSINLFSDLKESTQFLMLVLGLCFNRTNSWWLEMVLLMTWNAVDFIHSFKMLWEGL